MNGAVLTDQEGGAVLRARRPLRGRGALSDMTANGAVISDSSILPDGRSGGEIRNEVAESGIWNV